MKTSIGRKQSVLLALMVASFGAYTGWAIDPDLPYASGSSGADGPLTFSTIVNPGRRGHAIAYDSAAKKIYLFSGYSDTSNLRYVSDTWSFDGTNWTKIVTAQTPPPRTGAMMVYDPVRAETILFGGNNDGGRLNDTWGFNGTTWTLKSPASVPTVRNNAAIVFDAKNSQVVMWGGENGGDDTWIWDGSNWNFRTPASRPGADSGAAMAYDAARQRVVLFRPNNHETWTWDGNNWSQVTPSVSPPARRYSAFAYLPAAQHCILFSGDNQTPDSWIWDGTTWKQVSPNHVPPGRSSSTMVYDDFVGRVVLNGGNTYNVDANDSDTWFWNGTDWTFRSGKVQNFDMSARANGVWNFTTIDVPPAVTVAFKVNATKTPVRWLATGDVNIKGTVAADGQYGSASLPDGVVAAGGPGGFDGGRGGTRFDQSGSYAGTPGSGPGGGNAGVTSRQDGSDGSYANGPAYGNVFLQPLVGGSGGGGGGAGDVGPGGNGGGGGGAILIASSRDIIVDGSITANGGQRQHSGYSWGGRGSGGAILLRADRIRGQGNLWAYGGDNGNNNGRIRLEAYDRPLAANTTPGSVNSVPLQGADIQSQATLTITSISGKNVVQPPGGQLSSPDVVFSQAGPIQVQVAGSNIPDGTEVRIRVTSNGAVSTAGPQVMTGGVTTFSLTVPKGTGTVQAFADFRVTAGN